VTSIDDDPVRTRIAEAVDVLRQLGFPRAQQNERTALTLLAMLALTPDRPWSDASAPLVRLRGVSDFARAHYARNYAENTRETIRDDSVAPMVNAGVLIPNPDDPKRPKNSSKFCYQIEPAALEVLWAYGTEEWADRLATYRASRTSLAERYRRARADALITVPVSDDEVITLSPSGQNVLIDQILRAFRRRFAPGSQVLYVGDAADKFKHLKVAEMAALGVVFTPASKIPDVILYLEERGWLILIEAAFSGGPVDGKRYDELTGLFVGAAGKARLIMVTAFETRRAMYPYVESLSWESEVWFADEPDHLVHWNGPKFLRPFDDEEQDETGDMAR